MPRLTTIASCIIAVFGVSVTQSITSTTSPGTLAQRHGAPNRALAVGRAGRTALPSAPRFGDIRRDHPRWTAAAPASAQRPEHAAQTLAVGNCNDSGPGSLRAALADALDGDVISLVGLGCSSINLTSGALVANVGVTLRGPGMDQLAIDGGANDLVIHHAAGTAPFIIERLTIRNGRTDHGDGGCIWSQRDVEIRSSRITGCQSLPDADAGYLMAQGAAVGTLGSLKLSHSIVTGNLAVGEKVYGGALTSLGAVYIADSVISNNSGTAVHAAAGGGLCAQGDTTIVASSFTGNTVAASNGSVRGGGVFVVQNLMLEASAVSGNSATSPADGAFGGGVLTHGELVLDGATISDNHAEGLSAAFGGGVAASYEIEVRTAVVTGNTATSVAGAARGGGAYVGGDFVGKYSLELSDNEAISVNGTAYGGGLQVTNGLAGLQYATISGNRAHSEHERSYGGGINAGDDAGDVSGDIAVILSTISGNMASSNCGSCFIMGGGIHAFGGVMVNYDTVRDNAALGVSGGTARGGGIAAQSSTSDPDSDGRIMLTQSTVSGNRAIGGEGFGGGVFSLNNNVQVDASTVAFNEASTAAGGVFARNIVDSYSAVVSSWLLSSIVARNEAPSDPDIGTYAGSTPLAVDGGHNLVTVTSNTANLPIDTIFADPVLEPLANNGGPTATHALFACSPAIDAGSNPFGLVTDQRTEPWLREWGGGPDIGAFELQPDADRIFTDGFEAGCP